MLMTQDCVCGFCYIWYLFDIFVHCNIELMLQVLHMECHGTGTPLGDPIEVGALQAGSLQEGARLQPMATSAVKTSVGHLEAGHWNTIHYEDWKMFESPNHSFTDHTDATFQPMINLKRFCSNLENNPLLILPTRELQLPPVCWRPWRCWADAPQGPCFFIIYFSQKILEFRFRIFPAVSGFDSCPFVHLSTGLCSCAPLLFESTLRSSGRSSSGKGHGLRELQR